MATAIAVTLGLPAMALIQPGSRPLTQAIDGTVPGLSPGSTVADAPSTAVFRGTRGPAGHLQDRETAATTLGAEVQRLSDEADSVDRLWQAFSEQCGGEPRRPETDFGRRWFPVLNGEREDGVDQIDPQFARTPHCAELIQLVRQSGEGIRRDLRRALATARRARVDPGTEVGLLRWHSLELP